MRRILALAVLGFFAASASARAAAPPDPVLCVSSYIDLTSFRSKAYDVNNVPDKKSGINFYGLGQFVDNFIGVDFDDRANTLGQRFKVSTFIVSATTDAYINESLDVAFVKSMKPEEIYPKQRVMFETVRACDLAYGFMPATNEAPPPARVASLLIGRMDNEDKANAARLAALDDRACAVRFGLTSQLFPAGSPGQQDMLQRYSVIAGKLGPLQPLPPETFVSRLKDEMVMLATKMQGGASYSADMLIEEVHACETRLGMPVSDIQMNGKP